MSADGLGPWRDWNSWVADPAGLAQAAYDYGVDAWQRTILYADIRRQRGNQYRAHLQERVPNVLNFQSEIVLLGRDLPHPVNYGLVRILPENGVSADSAKRPFIVFDPRAGHGPGIGGFKPDSEIGAALNAGHACYFVGFSPDPVPGQSIEDVMRAQAEFVRTVAALHPESEGKPAVIGNCQAGWQLMMTASVWPDIFGPIIIAGSPLSYWAGDKPMRYAGGLLGGSWITALTGDVGAGRWDGAWLVQNFENLDPANTLWSKQYDVYANVDTEGPRYLGFERYWGGYVFLNDGEMQYIVDNLFIGNRLATAELSTSDGIRIDLRNIRSPIVVFCSHGDNITPPAQALGWITDLYRNDEDVIGNDQTIVFATHDSIGHLGIFVSSSVGRKEHRKFTANIDIIDMLPAGIYRAEVEGRPEDEADDLLGDDEFLMKIRRSGVDEVREIVKPDQREESCFAVAARISEINLALYRNIFQPWVRAFSTEYTARCLQSLHPLRIGYEWWSDQHPLASAIKDAAAHARANRCQISDKNPFLQLQNACSSAIEGLLDVYRDHRDQIYANTFQMIYGAPAVQAWAGRSQHDSPSPRQHPGDTPEHRAWLSSELQRLHADMEHGGLFEAMVRAVLLIVQEHGETADERHFRHGEQLVTLDPERRIGLAEFRKLARRQALLMRLDPISATNAIPHLLEKTTAENIRVAAKLIADLPAVGELQADSDQGALQRILELFAHAADKMDLLEKSMQPSAADLLDDHAPKQGAANPGAVKEKPKVRAAIKSSKRKAPPKKVKSKRKVNKS